MRLSLRTLWDPSTEVPERAPIGTALVEVHDLVVAVGERAILQGVDLVARAGELVALVGPNGAGKSTLVNVLSGDRPATAGTVEIAGVPLSAWEAADLSRVRAVLPQRTTVAFPFTVEQVVLMGRAPWLGTDAEDEDDALVASSMAAAEVDHLARRTMPTLSGGEAARTALARVLAQATQVVLLDEPTAALDLHHQELTMQVVRRGVDDGAAAVVVLHDLALAAAYADRIVLLEGGAVRAVGAPADVLDADLLSEVYRHPVEVVQHPHTGALLVVPVR